MEHVLCCNILKHLETFDILSDNQHGFWAKRSCKTQLIQTIQDLAKSISDKIQIEMAILGFSKCFDTVSHSKLLYKSNFYGIQNSTLEWIKIFLTGRTQKVVLNGESSPEVRIKSGVPQGTVLGPLLFIIFINDIVEQTKSKRELFADNCLLYRTINAVSDSVILQTDLNHLCERASTWQMRIKKEEVLYH